MEQNVTIKPIDKGFHGVFSYRVKWHETVVSEWWGLRNGGISHAGVSTHEVVRDLIAATSSAIDSLNCGTMPGILDASMVLPVPGGPNINRLWDPAAATSIALLANFCPRTSENSRFTGVNSGKGRSAGSSTALPARCPTT